MKTPNKILYRQIKNQLGSFLSVVVIVMVAVGFYVVLKTITQNYQIASEKYYTDYSLADYVFYGLSFTAEDIQKIKEIEGIKEVAGRMVADGKNDEVTLRVISLPSLTPKINIPYLYDGKLPNDDNECALLKKYAEANSLKTGDKIQFTLASKEYDLKISGLIASPEYVYLAKNIITPMADPKDFGAVVVRPNFFGKHDNFNEILITFNGKRDQKTVISKIKIAIGQTKISEEIQREDFLSYSFYKDDLQQLSTFSYIFPIVFFFIAGIVILVVQKRNILHDRRQIGIMKALGLKDRDIFWMYTKYACIVAGVGIILGIVLSFSIGPVILNLFKEMFEVPEFHYQIIYHYWFIPAIVSLFVCVSANCLAIREVLSINPAEAMHAEKPKNGKDIFVQKTFLWRRLSFNSRYAMKTALRNYGRFWAAVLGMIATITLAVFSFGFMDTFNEIITGYYAKVAQYDLAIYLDNTPYTQEMSFLNNQNIKESKKTLLLPVKIENGTSSKNITLFLSDDFYSTHQINNISGNAANIKNGIAIPRYFARMLNVEVGDSIQISTSDKTIDATVTISDITNQTTGFYALGTFNFAKEKFRLPTIYYNAVFAKINSNSEIVKSNIEKQPEVLSVISKSEDEKNLIKMLDVFKVYIYILIFFAIVLGVAVLYSISSVNLLSRNYEFVVLKVMGYGTKEILLAYAKELLWQMSIAIPFGFLFGNLVLLTVNNAFSTDSFEMINNIYFSSYLYSLILLISIIGIVLLNARNKIEKLDLVEGLKSREE
ncbi:MAG: ABC transporter permease [Patescibacteria group bacterium]|jgi:putative ABC transport system permease protein